LKILGELLVLCTCWFWVVVWILVAILPVAAAQLYCANTGLRLFPQLAFLPVYQALLLVLNTLVAIFVFHESAILFSDHRRCAYFMLGLLSIAFGICLLRFRRSVLAEIAEAQHPVHEVELASRRSIRATCDGSTLLIATSAC